MSDTARKKSNQTIKRRRKAVNKSAPLPVGDYTSIRVPVPQPSSMNRNRPISGLIQAQLQHIQHAESGRLPKNKRAGIKLEDIHTEAEAASYIAAVTKLLHPQGYKKPNLRPSS
jgi:hypothetical protein